MDKTFMEQLRKLILDETIYLRHYEGIVVNTEDISGLGRVCCVVPVLGVMSAAIGFWCSPRDKKSLITPMMNDHVEIYFMEGDKNRPVYLGIVSEAKGMLPQNYADSKTQVLFEANDKSFSIKYDDLTKSFSVGNNEVTIDATTDSAFMTLIAAVAALVSLPVPTSVTGKLNAQGDNIPI